MLRTIKQAAEETGISESAIRFYDRRGLLPRMKRNEAGYRLFDDAGIDELYFVNYLRCSEMPIKDIRQIAEWVASGEAPIEKRYSLLVKRREAVRRRIRELTDALGFLDLCCERCEHAMAEGVGTDDFRRAEEAQMLAAMQIIREKRQNMR